MPMSTIILHVKTHAPELGPKPEVPLAPSAKQPKVETPHRERRIIQFTMPMPLAPLWEKLHRRALEVNGTDDTKWLDGYGRMVPCGDCRMHWSQMVQRTPPTWDNYFQWTVDRHNEVNARLGKPILTSEEALAKWATPEVSKPVS